MNLSNAQRSSVESRRESLARAQVLLEEALQRLDEYAEAPELGARLDEILALLKARLTDPLDERGQAPPSAESFPPSVGS
jgi:hypothetical protein